MIAVRSRHEEEKDRSLHAVAEDLFPTKGRRDRGYQELKLKRDDSREVEARGGKRPEFTRGK